jgi:hypothetical protein
MLGKAITAADAVGQQTTSSWYTFENGVTVRVARLGSQHIAEFVRHPVVDLPDPNKYAAFALSPYGGVIVDGYVTSEALTDEEQISLLDRFSPAATTLTRLASVRKEVEAALEKETDPTQAQSLRNRLKYLHGQGDDGLKPVPYLSLVVPDQWKHLYNNPVVSLTGTPKVYSQYRLIKPTMFSGRMRVVAQLLMGMGRQTPPTKEQQLVSRGANNADHVAVEDYRHDAKDPERSKDDECLGSLDYWFHWLQTHGVYKTDGGRYYLIRISAAGVWAMRLPVLAMSKWAPTISTAPRICSSIFRTCRSTRRGIARKTSRRLPSPISTISARSMRDRPTSLLARMFSGRWGTNWCRWRTGWTPKNSSRTTRASVHSLSGR